MFIGRERELASLKEFYEKDGQEAYFYTATKVPYWAESLPCLT